MLIRDEAALEVLVREPQPGRPARRLSREVRKISTLRRLGFRAEPKFETKATPEEEEARRAMVERAVRAFRQGHSAHARQTAAEAAASLSTDTEQVDALLASAYRWHREGKPGKEILRAFLDTFELWLTEAGKAKVDLVFDGVDLERLPPSLGLLLLASTRLTRDHFTRREAYCERLRRALIGKDGRNERQVEAMLRGLRA